VNKVIADNYQIYVHTQNVVWRYKNITETPWSTDFWSCGSHAAM